MTLFLKRIQISVGLILQNLYNTPTHVSAFVHQKFLRTHGENVVFLLSQLCVLVPEMRETSLKALRFMDTQKENLNIHTAGGFVLAHSTLDQENDELMQMIDYTSEFPKTVQSGSSNMATRVFVYHALAIWATSNKNVSKLSDIVNVGIARIFKEDKPNLQLTASKKINQHYEEWVYFVTHVIIVGTMWGELKKPVGGSQVAWRHITNIITAWAYDLKPHASQNLEVWIELLCCLNLLSEHEQVNILEDPSLFDIEIDIRDQMQHYHTHTLWAFFHATRLNKSATISENPSRSSTDKTINRRSRSRSRSREKGKNSNKDNKIHSGSNNSNNSSNSSNSSSSSSSSKIGGKITTPIVFEEELEEC